MWRGAGSRRWIAASGGVLINGLILAALVLVEQAPPQLEEPPVLILELERPRKPETPERGTSTPAGRASAPAARPSATTAAGETSAPADQESAPTAIEPAWQVDPKAVDRWKLTEGVPERGWGRYYRACKGLSSEHMTPEEKERCYSGWGGGGKDKRPSPAFIGPIDERKWEDHEFSGPPRRTSADDDKRRRRDLCRVYNQMRKADPSMKPVLRQGACR